MSSCGDGGLSFDDTLTLSAFYRDFSDTNSIIAAAEKEATENADCLLSDTVSLLSEIEKFSAVGVAGVQSVIFENIFEQHVKPFEERYEAAKAISTKLWQEYSAMNNRLDYLPLDSDEYKSLNAEREAKKSAYDTAHEQTTPLYDDWQSERQRCFCIYTFKPLHVDLLYGLLRRPDNQAPRAWQTLGRRIFECLRNISNLLRKTPHRHLFCCSYQREQKIPQSNRQRHRKCPSADPSPVASRHFPPHISGTTGPYICAISL